VIQGIWTDLARVHWAQESGRSYATCRNLRRHGITSSLSPTGCGKGGDGQDDGAEGDHGCSEGSADVCYPLDSNHLLLYLSSGEMKRDGDSPVSTLRGHSEASSEAHINPEGQGRVLWDNASKCRRAAQVTKTPIAQDGVEWGSGAGASRRPSSTTL
jgi:hypothetical protein